MSANTYGRAVDIPLTNKSGGALAPGDVVIVDTSTNEAVTTTTSAASLLAAGIVQDAIANNGVGRVRIQGYAPLVNVNAAVTRGHFGATHTVAKQAADVGTSRAAGTFLLFLTSSATPSALIYPVDLAGAALTNPMTTAEDIIKGGAAGAPARLAVGAAGGALSVINGGVAWNSGTAFPASKLTGDRYWRTDLGLEAYWDGTRWLSTELFREPVATQESGSVLPVSTNNTLGYLPTWKTEYALYLVKLYAFTNVITTNDGTKFWTVAAVDDAGSTIGSFTTAADTAGTKAHHIATLNTAYTSTNTLVAVSLTKTSTPGVIYVAASISYRLILT